MHNRKKLSLGKDLFSFFMAGVVLFWCFDLIAVEPEEGTEVLKQETKESSVTEVQPQGQTERSSFVSSPLQFGLDFSYSNYTLKNYEYNTGVTSNSAGNFFALSLEWLPLIQYGKLGIGGTLGAYLLSEGNVSSASALVGRAGVSVFPIGVSLSYHLDYFFHQILVPYLRFGITHHIVDQSSSDGSVSKSGKANPTTWDFIVGGQFNLYWLEPSVANQFDANHGVNETYIFFEYFVSHRFSTDAANVEVGIFRGGLRFEF